jgi:hypothetical protein
VNRLVDFPSPSVDFKPQLFSKARHAIRCAAIVSQLPYSVRKIWILAKGIYFWRNFSQISVRTILTHALVLLLQSDGHQPFLLENQTSASCETPQICLRF